MSYYLMPRGWMDDPIFEGEPYTRAQAWIWLIEKAAYQPATVKIDRRPTQLERGELSFSEAFLAKQWKWPKARVPRFLADLTTSGMIDRRNSRGSSPSHGKSIITICNYSAFQRRSPLESSFESSSESCFSLDLSHSRAFYESSSESDFELHNNQKKVNNIYNPPRPPSEGIPPLVGDNAEQPAPGADTHHSEGQPEAVSPSHQSTAKTGDGHDRRKRAKQLPIDWTPGDRGWDYASGRGFHDEEIRDEFEGFCNHHRSRGQTMVDWDLAWCNWVRNAVKFASNRQGGGPRQPDGLVAAMRRLRLPGEED